MTDTVVEVMRHAFTAGYTIAQAKHICCDEHEAGAKARAEREAVEEFDEYIREMDEAGRLRTKHALIPLGGGVYTCVCAVSDCEAIP